MLIQEITSLGVSQPRCCIIMCRPSDGTLSWGPVGQLRSRKVVAIADATAAEFQIPAITSCGTYVGCLLTVAPQSTLDVPKDGQTSLTQHYALHNICSIIL